MAPNSGNAEKRGAISMPGVAEAVGVARQFGEQLRPARRPFAQDARQAVHLDPGHRAASGVDGERRDDSLAIRFDPLGQASEDSGAAFGAERFPSGLGIAQSGGDGRDVFDGEFVIGLAGARVDGFHCCAFQCETISEPPANHASSRPASSASSASTASIR